MPARAADLDWTVERAHALPDDGNRYEVLDGGLFVTPAPTWRHQGVVSELHPKLHAYVRARGIGWAMVAPADVVFSPSTARADRHRKRAIHRQEDVGEYWMIDTGQRFVER